MSVRLPFASRWVLVSLVTWFLPAASAEDVTAVSTSAVAIQEDENSLTLGNGIVTARILKRNVDIGSLVYNGTELLTDKSGHAGGHWSLDTTGGKGLETKVTIDPNTNGGQRAEVSVNGISGGIKMALGEGIGMVQSALRARTTLPS